ncbi:MAG TPA: potassium channel family protein [Acidimicrobiales bacterium]|nr:potassium channel family protein [Acidimicrobiales bacterium]
MTVLALLVGVALVVFVCWDIVLTLFHPAARGPLSYLGNRATWRAIRGVSLRLLGGRGLNYAGPFAMVINLLVWVVGLWLGYALIYLPYLESFSYDPSTPFAAKGILEALYFSGASITTGGFGDVVATGGVLRLVAIAEAASGFGVLSSAIAFVLAVYPLISQLRSTSLQLADAGALELEGAARVVSRAGPSKLTAIVQDLTEDHEHLKRFPILYYFESGNREESLSTMVRGSSLLLVALTCAPSSNVEYASVYAEMLEHVVARLLEDLERDFLGGRRRGDGPARPSAEEARDGLRRLCASDAPSDQDIDAEERWDRLASLLVRADMVLEALGREHGHDARRVLPR